MMNSRERFLAILRGEPVDRPPLFPEGIRDEVRRTWHAQGLPPRARLAKLYDYDPFDELDPDVYPSPEIKDWSNPERTLALLRQRLDPDDPRRLPSDWASKVKKWRRRDYPLFLRIHQGLFLSLGVEDWRSFAPALLRLVDQPDFVDEVLAIQAGFAARLAEKIFSQVEVDGVICSEPIAGNHGVLVSPAMYRRFEINGYAQLFQAVQRAGVPALIWRSYANPAALLPEVVKAPFNALWLCETPPGALSLVRVRALVGSQMTLIGGIDADVLLQDHTAIRRAVAEVRPYIAQGHVIPLADGRVRETVLYANYRFYRQELARVFNPPGH
jgi:hypothetical protein